jgi:uncharacterized membrane protein YhaH (DUF805 family)
MNMFENTLGGETIMNWYMDVMKQYTVFTGRARRQEYWMFFLINFAIAFAIGFVTGLLRLGAVGSALSSLYMLAVLVPSVAVGIRRMHDTDHSGWWLLVPILNLVYACTEGQPGPNQYGPNPKGLSNAAPVPNY